MSTSMRRNGLGIKFFENQNNEKKSSTSSSQPDLASQSSEALVADNPIRFSPTLSGRPAAVTPSLPSRRSAPNSQAFTPSLPPRKLGPDSQADCFKLLDEILSTTLRDQAETFVRKSSSTPRVGWQSSPRKQSGGFSTATVVSPPLRNQPQVQTAPGNSGGRNYRSNTYSGPETPGIVHSKTNSGSEVCGASDSHFRSLSTGLSPSPTTTLHSPHSFTNLSNRLLKKLPRVPNISKRIRVPSQIFPYFTNQQEAEIERKVYSKKHSCERHENCTDCTNVEFAYWENLKMSTSIPADERQKIIANNKSLRTIKNELDSLLDNGMISEETYSIIIDALPSETSLNNAARRNVVPSTPTPDPNPLSTAINNMRLNNNSDPPSYNSSTTGPPALPGRTPPQPERPEIGRATSLYAYEGAPEDCSFAVGETLIVYEYMNNEWCYGKNLRTGRQGLFPSNYVQFKPQQAPTPNPNAYGAYGNNDKQNVYGGGYPGQYQQPQGPPPPGPSNPYNSAVPPMQIAEQPVEHKPGKGAEMGKKFGKKLGNAAIFGAGATLGGDLVNSIF